MGKKLACAPERHAQDSAHASHRRCARTVLVRLTARPDLSNAEMCVVPGVSCTSYSPP